MTPPWCGWRSCGASKPPVSTSSRPPRSPPPRPIDPTNLDLAVLDFDLGDGYGNEIATHLRATNKTIAIAYFTSSAAEATAARHSEADLIFEKPQDTDPLLAWALDQQR